MLLDDLVKLEVIDQTSLFDEQHQWIGMGF